MAAKRKRATQKKKKKTDWPKRHHTLFRPDRLSYLKKNRLGSHKGDCVFCEAISLGVGKDNLVVSLTKNVAVLLNKYPYNSGHVLVLPRRHQADPLDLKPEEQVELYQVLHKAIDALRKSYEAPGMNVGLNLGSAAGAGIPEHMHFHLVPRWLGDMNFFPVLAESKVIPETLEQTFDRLLPYFNETRD